MIHQGASRSLLARAGQVLTLAALLTSGGCQGGPAGDKPGAADADQPAAERKPLIALIRAADWMGSEWTEDAIQSGLQQSGLQAGQDYEMKISSAGGDLATLPSLIDASIDANAALIVALQDPTLQAAVQRVKSQPVVFHLLSDPFAAGAGQSDSNHLPNVTGVYSPGFGDPEQTRRVDLIRRLVPRGRRIGVLFSPEEALSVTFKDRMTKAAAQVGLRVTATPVSRIDEVADATRSLCGKVDAIEIYGNVTHSGFPSLVKVAKECKLPVFTMSRFEAAKGAVASYFPDFQQGGIEAGKMIGRILSGESPANIPFYRVERAHLAVNPTWAKELGLTVPQEVLEEAIMVVGGDQRADQ